MSDNNFSNLKKIIAPAGVQLNSNYLKIGDKFMKVFFFFSYPRYLSSGWFESIINLANLFDIAIFVNPVDTGLALKNLRKKTAQIESQIGDQQEKGLVRDPMLETALRDVESLRDSLQQAEEKLFSIGVYIALYADTLEELGRLESQVISAMEAKLVYIKPALFQQLDGLLSILPLGQDKLSVTQPMDSGPISSFFPFVSEDLTSDQGVLYGINLHNNSLVIFDRFSMENANQVVFAKSGGGKSIVGSEPVLIKQNDEVRLTEIGPLIEGFIDQKGAEQIDEELEGVIDPGVEVWSFDKNLKASWSKVTVAARKKAPDHFYRFTTKSGRLITTTGDHNMLVLKNGRLVATKSSEVALGEYTPLPRTVAETEQPQRFLNLLGALKTSNRIYVKGASELIQANYQFLKKISLDDRFDRYLYKYRAGRVVPLSYFQKIVSALQIDIHSPAISRLEITSRSDKTSLPALFPVEEPLLKILGYIAAEGTITENSVLISNLDREVLGDIKSALDKMKVAFYFADRGVVIAVRPFVELVKVLGGKVTSADKKVAPLLFNLKKEVIAAYLSAYFEGDGGVESDSITATSKSRRLLSEISYLLYYFGIVGRISEIYKKAPGWKQKKTYWKLTISGQENLRKFVDYINFVSQRKKNLATHIVQKQGNTNVDVVPEVSGIFKEIFSLLPSQLHRFPEISALKRDVYRPSPDKLGEIIQKIEERIRNFKTLGDRWEILNDLPGLDSLIHTGSEKPDFNRQLWRALGQSWRTMKNRSAQPRLANVLKAWSIIENGHYHSVEEIKNVVHSGFKAMNLPIQQFNRSLSSALVDRPQSNPSYYSMQKAAQWVWQNYQEKLAAPYRIEELLSQLKVLAHSDLFWDPIVTIQKIENTKEKYVYDLTVDNEVFLAGEGGMFVHNSYATKLEIIRSLMMGIDTIVIDPENEYQRLAENFSGSFFNISLSSHEHINPFDIPIVPENETSADVLRSHIVVLAGLLKLMLGKVTPEEDALLDRAITETYASREIIPGEDFSKAKPPLLEDLEAVLRDMEGGRGIAERLYKFTKGSFAGFLNQPTNVDINNRLIIFSIRDLEDELRPIAMYVILNFIWNLIRAKLKKRIMIIDEAWWMMKYEESAAFLFGLAKRSRKYYLGVSTITQDVEDFLRSPYGRPIITNSSVQLLLRQAPATIDIVAKAFNLTDAEKTLLLTAEVGTGLFFAGRRHVAIQIIASYFEDQIITTNPQQLLEEKAQGKA